jgi:hypothetical protein
MSVKLPVRGFTVKLGVSGFVWLSVGHDTDCPYQGFSYFIISCADV